MMAPRSKQALLIRVKFDKDQITHFKIDLSVFGIGQTFHLCLSLSHIGMALLQDLVLLLEHCRDCQ